MNGTYWGQVLLVGLGGFLGSAARFMVATFVQRVTLGAFPYGTLTVNVLGCLVIGFLGGLLESRQILGPGQRLFLLVGVLGGFTTFSAFAFETLGLANTVTVGKALVNVGAHVLLGLSAAWISYVGAQALSASPGVS